MKAENIAEALNDIDFDMVEEAEMKKTTAVFRFFKKKTICIAAVFAVLLGGTAAAAGFYWMKPNVQVQEDSMSLHLSGDIVTLPESTVREVLAVCDPLRGNKSFFAFETLDEWQEFFELPFVSSTRLAVDESPKWVDYGSGSLIPEGTIDTIVTAEETDGIYKLCLMITQMNVEWYDNDAENGNCAWKGNMMIHVPLNETVVREGTFERLLNEDMNAEILMEYTTAAGIPCVIGKITSAHTATLYLYYSYQSVVYEIEVMAVSSEEEEMILEDLKMIAETLQVVYPNSVS